MLASLCPAKAWPRLLMVVRMTPSIDSLIFKSLDYVTCFKMMQRNRAICKRFADMAIDWHLTVIVNEITSRIATGTHVSANFAGYLN